MKTKNILSIDLFCKVVDNFGDIGVCYRLAKEFSRNNIDIFLYVDDLETFKKICPSVQTTKNIQFLANDKITVIKWIPFAESYSPSNVVIEAFACNLDESYTSSFNEKTLWINLEYLSAEDWVESCHCLPSLQSNGVKKFFFFPGFNSKTGGINFEEYFYTLSNQESREFIFNKFKLPLELNTYFLCLLFTYENKMVIPLMESIIKNKKNVIFLLPQGRITKFLQNSKEFNLLKSSNLNVKFIEFPMMQQDEFNKIIKGCDLNIVRGEDSISQAIIAGKPFIWHIYKQEEDAHLDKIKAFLAKYTQCIPNEISCILNKTFLTFNTDESNNNIVVSTFNDFMLEYEEICSYSKGIAAILFNNRNLCSNLLKFINEKNKDFL